VRPAHDARRRGRARLLPDAPPDDGERNDAPVKGKRFDDYLRIARRKVCRHCHYELHTKAGRRKWVMKQRARMIVGKW
jgi:hypothetical protein